ncbi:hypothetical protein GCM10023149_23390 [Mucilaginibacter gynuensis]|uniref:Uncharacterized protein n=1 Tax=Mucilaginibacter gynuensis TaxID=1302236 RepID=A0ABP8GEZ9_9SPHI
MEKTGKISLHAVAAQSLFQICFKNADLLHNGELKKDRWALNLRDKIQNIKQITDKCTDISWIEYHNYLRDRYNKICKTIEDGNPKRLMGFEYLMILPVLMYSNIADHEKFNNKFTDTVKPVKETSPGKLTAANIENANEPIGIPVLYTPNSFGRFDILRNPDNGILHFYPNGDLIFDGNIHQLIRRDAIKSVDTHHMFGDNTTWVKIQYNREGKLAVAYFAQIDHGANNLLLTEPHDLLKLINT